MKKEQYMGSDLSANERKKERKRFKKKVEEDLGRSLEFRVERLEKMVERLMKDNDSWSCKSLNSGGKNLN